MGEVAEHIGHNSSTIGEYCQNFVPDASAMAAFSKYTPAFIIQKAKQGQLAAMMDGLKDLMFIVIKKPDYGECLFPSSPGEYGVAVCTCDEKECKNKKALNLVVDADKGPMRLLQFLDGSLLSQKDAISAIVEGILDEKGRINAANVAKVT